jgi:hypothetical protein
MKKTKKIITIVTVVTLISSTLFYACKRTIDYDDFQKSKNLSNISLNLESPSYNSQDSTIIDSLSTLTANMINSMNQLNQNDFCSLKTILDSNISNTNKMLLISTNNDLTTFYNASVSLSNYVDVNNYNNILATESSKLIFNYFLKPKVPFMDDTNKPNLDCRSYVAAHNACSFGFGTCLASAMLAGPMWPAAASICALSMMGCMYANDSANPECAAKYQWNILPNIPNFSNFEDICQ